MNIRSPCTLQAGPITGCYDCKQGGIVDVTCYTAVPPWTTVTCADHTISVECNPQNQSTRVRLYFDNALINSKCYTICGDKNVSVALQGALFYHTDESDIFNAHTSKTVPQLDWFYDFHLPEFEPLKMVFVEHWRATLTIVVLLSSFSRIYLDR